MISSAIIPQPLAKLPWRLIFLVVGIAGIGITTLYSAAGGAAQPWATKQAIVILFFMAVAIAMSWTSESTIKKVAFPIYIAVTVMLVLVEMLGFVGKGAQRWLDLGFIRLQPSEFMKPGIVLVLARFYELLPAGDIRKWRAIWPAAALIGFPAALIILQPDLGTALMVTFIGVTVMFVAGVPFRVFLIPGAALAVAIPIVYQLLHGYQKKRIDTFLDPESDPLGAGYHISQSKIAIGSGGIFGKGYLQGSQSHLDYLPEGHTDFVFATMVEEWGMVGGASADLRVRLRHPLGNARCQQRPQPFCAACGGRPFGDDLLLRVDQPADGHGPGAGRRRSTAPRQLRRIGRDDRNAVPRPADGPRTAATHDLATSLVRLTSSGCAPNFSMLPAQPLRASI